MKIENTYFCDFVTVSATLSA